MSETPKLEEPLDNPDVSRQANRDLDRLMDGAGFAADAARRIVPEFAALDRLPPAQGQNQQPKKHERVAQQRLRKASLIADALNSGDGVIDHLSSPEHAQDARREGLIQ